MAQRITDVYQPGWRSFLAILAISLLSACAAMDQDTNGSRLSSPDFAGGTASEMNNQPPPVFNEGMIAKEEAGPSAGMAVRPEPVETIVLEGEPGYEEGIKIIGVSFLSAGYMLNFRYEVVDPEQSMPMFDRNVIPYLIHEKSGAKFAVPSPAKVGPLRATTKKPEKDKKYYIMFANPGRYVKEGDLVTVVVGEHRFEHLAVQ